MLTREKVTSAAFRAFMKLNYCGTLDAAVRAEMLAVLRCTPEEMDEVLRDPAVRNEIFGAVPCSNL